MTKVVCDKCGKVIYTDSSPSTTMWTDVSISYVEGGQKLCCHKTFDLCGECKDALVAFVRGEEGLKND